MLYADVILPLPLYGTFTYSVPDDLRDALCMGSRVLVQFGRKKFYTGIVAAIHSDFEGGYEVKPIMTLLDRTPIVRNPQIRLWEWISDYYLCSCGDVYKAAVPASLKPESETWLSLNPDYELPDGESFSIDEAMVVQLLQQEKKLRAGDVETRLNLKMSGRVMSRMLERGIIEISETVGERYRPKKITHVRLLADRDNTDSLHEVFASIGKARQQEKALLAYLDLSRWTVRDRLPRPVTREELLVRSGVSPAVLKALCDKGVMECFKVTVNRFKPAEQPQPIRLSPLSGLQQKALDEITLSLREKNVCLLHGVTGSGKTEIYTHLINRALNDGNQVLFLVPEISLTTQLTDRLRAVFGERLLVYHSRFSDNERADIWKRLLAGHEPCVVIGARSALFLPFAHIGLVIVDEEHESSYKQYDPAPRYNARDVAIVLASMHGAKTLLGSATPSVETYYKASQGKYGLVSLDQRFSDASLPDVEIVDMKEQRKQKRSNGIISQPLAEAVTESLAARHQSILFQNRRGFAPFVICKTCGWTPKCPNCDVSLVYHKHVGILRCHYCGHTMQLPVLCPACRENSIEVYGYGTERIAEEVSLHFDKARVERMDLDTTRNKDAHQKIIEGFARHDTDILVGTQMVSKGLDFADVDVVGVLNADTILNFPDFRSNERAFNMLEQVAGRAGRRSHPGKVIIQTTDPANRVLAHVAAHDYQTYYGEELSARRNLNYPPFSRIIMVYVKNRDEKTAEAAANLLTDALREVFGARVLGPERPLVSRVASFYLRQTMMKVEAGASMAKVKAILRTIYESLARDPRLKSSTVYYDVDPA